jgi:hypothetical protein
MATTGELFARSIELLMDPHAALLAAGNEYLFKLA